MNKGLFWGNIVTIYLIPMLFAWDWEHFITIFSRMRKEGMIEDTVQFSMSIGSFLFYIDIFLAIVAYRISKKYKVNESFNQPECR